MTQEKTRIYTKVSAKAVRGFKRMSATKDILVEPTGNGEFTVIITDKVNVTEAAREAAEILAADWLIDAVQAAQLFARFEAQVRTQAEAEAWARGAELREALEGIRAKKSETFAYKEDGYGDGFADAETSMRAQIRAVLTRHREQADAESKAREASLLWALDLAKREIENLGALPEDIEAAIQRVNLAAFPPALTEGTAP